MNGLRIMAIVALVIGMASVCSAQGAKIGYLDMQRALNNSDAGREAKEQLQTKLKKYQGEVNIKQEELQNLKSGLEKQGVALTDAARAAKEKDYQQKLKDFQRFTKDAEEDLQAKDAEFTKKIVEAMDKVVQEYGKKHGFTVIFDSRGAGMLYADQKADVTDEILKAFNSSKVQK